jgi:hypothetical protein
MPCVFDEIQLMYLQYLHAEMFTTECKVFSIHNLKFIIKINIFINTTSKDRKSGRNGFFIEVPLYDVKWFALAKTCLLRQVENNAYFVVRYFFLSFFFVGRK